MPKRLLRKFLLIFVGAVVIALGISLFRATTATVTFQYAVTDLGVLPGYTQSFPESLNDKGQIVGYSSTSSNSGTSNDSRHAFLWESGKMTDLGVLKGYDNSSAVDINNKEQVVGTLSGSNSSHAFLWQHNKMIDLGTLNGDKNSEAVAINKAGQVVGNSGEGIGNKIFLWQKGLMQIVPIKDPSYFPPELVIVSASDINNLGQIAATSQFRNSWHPLLSKNGVVTSFDKYFSIPLCPGLPKINNNGKLIVSGRTGVGFSDCSAFLGKNGKLVDLGYLGGSGSPAGLLAAPYGINDLGRVVGMSFINNTGNKFGGTYHAFIWYNNKMTDLNSFLPTNSGWELTEARGINNKGQIIGLGKYNGQQKAFLLTPMRVTQ